MDFKIKKISVVVYCNGNFEETEKTLFSIIDQNLSHILYDVLILNDNANKNFTNKLNNFIKDRELINYHVFSFEGYFGLPALFSFLLKNKIGNNPYTTIIKSGDIIYDGWLEHFVDDLYKLDMDLYLFDLNDEFLIPKDKIGANGKKYVVSKSKMPMPFLPGKVSQKEAINTYPLFLGKIWKTRKIKRITLNEDKILYQDIFMYYQMILLSKKIWYEKNYVGTIRRHSWIPDVMDKKRIELLSLTLNKMISNNPYINGVVLQLLALALEKTPKEDRNEYILTNHRYLQNNYIIVRMYHLSKRKVLKLTKPFIDFGELPHDNDN
ncbi:MAG: hypothetical protein HDR43_01790 [Mycoplasma sp.]|nr:hypothetical protein [Mycoplasma sp.]